MAEASIRLRLSLWYSSVLLLGLILFGTGIWITLHRQLVAGVDERLVQKAQGLKRVLEVEDVKSDRRQAQIELSEFASEVPDGPLMQLTDPQGGMLLPASGEPFFPSAWMSGEAGPRTARARGRSFRIFVSRFDYAGQSYAALVATPLDDVDAVVGDFRNLLLALIPAVLLMASLGGFWISRRALAPVDEITRVARSISVRNLSHRLAVPQTGDELQRMSETWNEVLERLESAVQRIRQFTGDASHELRTPVTLIRSTAELALRRERDPEEYRRALRAIELEATRMTELTTSLLTLARADSDNIEMPLASVDLRSMAAEVVEQNQPVASDKGVSLRMEDDGELASAAANDAGLRRLLLILVDNAIKYTPRGGAVTVSVTAMDDAVEVAVKDTGVGIAAPALDHVFERFYRADEARSRGGAGLGLSIAQAIARAHGSRIEVESSVGQGSRFSLKLGSRPANLSENLQVSALASSPAGIA